MTSTKTINTSTNEIKILISFLIVKGLIKFVYMNPVTLLHEMYAAW